MRTHIIRTAPLLTLGLAAGCVDPRPLRVHLAADVVRPPRSAVIFFLDGVDRSRFDAMLAAGELPHIDERFVRGGVGVENAIACIPSVTYPNAVSLITGQFPGHHGIAGNHWFDRRTLEMPDYIRPESYRDVNRHFSAATIYDILADRPTANVQCHTRRGVSWTLDNSIPTGFNLLFGMFQSIDARAGGGIEDVASLANRIRRWPTVTMSYYPGIDETGHHFGSDSPQYRDVLKNADAVIGNVCEALARAGLADSTLFVLCSDHGHVPSPDNRRFNVERWLERHRGRKVVNRAIRGKNYRERYDILDPYDTVVINGAYRRAAIHLRGKRDWVDPPDVQEVRRLIETAPLLFELPAVEMVAWLDRPDGVRVRSRSGAALIERRTEGQRKLYRVTESTGNPLRLDGETDLRATDPSGWRDSREWLRATAGGAYPDFVPQIVEMFDTPRAGDIVLFAAGDWTFGRDDHGGHGSCLSRDMRVPMYFAGPGVPKGGRIACARIVDLMPTILDGLGEGARLRAFPAIDGVSVWTDIERATTRAPAASAGEAQ